MNVPMPGGSSTDARVRRVAAAYEALDGSAARLDALLALYASDARFRDPFNNVRGHAALRNIFEHMATQVREPRFCITESACEGDAAWLRWDFSFAGDRIDGASRLVFGADGRVLEHLDFWDPARQLYERVPLLGALMRLLRRRLAAPPQR